jgi:hypothetical protein
LFENKIEKTIEINDELDDVTTNENVIHYWHEESQLTEEDETIRLHQNGWLNDQWELLCKCYLLTNYHQSSMNNIPMQS